MDYIINGEKVNLLDVIEYGTPLQLTENYINYFNDMNTEVGFAKNILKKEDIGKWFFIITTERDSFKRLNNMGSLYPAKIRKNICSKPYETRDKAMKSLDSFIKLLKKELKKRIIEI